MGSAAASPSSAAAAPASGSFAARAVEGFGGRPAGGFGSAAAEGGGAAGGGGGGFMGAAGAAVGGGGGGGALGTAKNPVYMMQAEPTFWSQMWRSVRLLGLAFLFMAGERGSARAEGRAGPAACRPSVSALSRR